MKYMSAPSPKIASQCCASRADSDPAEGDRSGKIQNIDGVPHAVQFFSVEREV